MGGRGQDHPEFDSERAGDTSAEERSGTEEELHRALEAERHRSAARDFFDRAPLFRVDFEHDGTVSLRRKGYTYWPNRPPADATRWSVVSKHPDLEHAERRLRHITSPQIYYDDRGRLTQAPK